MRLLHIISSPRAARSASIEVAGAFIQTWADKYPEGTLDTLNVWDTDLLPFDGAAMEAKYAGLEGRELTSEQHSAWQRIKELADRFHRADILLFSVPMWNFGIPYRLKHLIDMISQKNVLFTFDERGLTGLLGGRKVVIIAARGTALGGDYPVKDFDHQGAYLTTWSRMVGIREVHEIVVEKTLFGPAEDRASRNDAYQRAMALANSLMPG